MKTNRITEQALVIIIQQNSEKTSFKTDFSEKRLGYCKHPQKRTYDFWVQADVLLHVSGASVSNQPDAVLTSSCSCALQIEQ